MEKHYLISVIIYDGLEWGHSVIQCFLKTSLSKDEIMEKYSGIKICMDFAYINYMEEITQQEFEIYKQEKTYIDLEGLYKQSDSYITPKKEVENEKRN